MLRAWCVHRDSGDAVMFTDVIQSSVSLHCTRALSTAQCPSEGCAICMAAPSRAGSLPSLCLLTEVNVQFHGLITTNLADKVRELSGGGERRGMT